MSKSVLMSIHPKWCELIASRKKTIEVRKTKPKLDEPFKCYIYCTRYKKGKLIFKKGNKFLGYKLTEVNGKVIGEFVCDKVYFRNCDMHDFDTITLEELSELSLVTQDDLLKYADRGNLCGWHISNLTIYDKPKELSEFTHACPDNVKACKMCHHTIDGMRCKPITRPPQSWCYVEEGE